jgi:ATP-binding cassette subfamily B protein
VRGEVGGRVRALWRTAILAWRAAPGWSAASVGLAGTQAALTMGTLLLTRILVDAIGSAHPGGREHVVLRILAGLALAALGAAVCQSLAWLATQAQSLTVTDHIQTAIQRKSVDLDLLFFENAAFHDSLYRAQQESAFRPAAILAAMGRGVQSLVLMVSLMAFVSLSHWGLGLLLLFAAVPGILPRIRYANQIFLWQKQCTAAERLATYFHMLLTHGAAAQEVKLMGLGPTLLDRYQGERKRMRGERMRINASYALVNTAANGGMVLVLLAAYLVIVHRAVQGAFSMGEVVMLILAFQRGQAALSELFGSLAELYEGCLFLTSLHEFLGLETRSSQAGPRTGGEPVFREVIRFRDVDFHYPGTSRKALCGVSFDIRAGERVAVVGANGSGKTTLVKLLCGLYRPSGGSITLDGTDLSTWEPEALRRLFAVVFQNHSRYHLTVRDNIWFGDTRSAPATEALAQAARTAGADDLIDRLPEGYETVLSNWFEGGTDLSAGEWQRIAIARGAFRHAPIVILDEPTSALDAHNEKAILEGLHRLTLGRTSIHISHRMANIRQADHILVLEGGRLVEEGTHGQLLELRGRYRQFFELQRTEPSPDPGGAPCS